MSNGDEGRGEERESRRGEREKGRIQRGTVERGVLEEGGIFFVHASHVNTILQRKYKKLLQNMNEIRKLF